MEGGIQSVLLSCLLLSLLVVASSDDSSLQSKCAPEFQKLTGCLDFAAAKTDTPTSQCCSSVTDIRNKDAACLCYIIQQTHAGSSTIKSLGLQFDRLLQLPQACKLANASVSDCPKLLNISPSSPDYSIFNGTAKTNSASTNATPTSGVVMHQNCFDGTFTIAVVSAIYLSIFGIWA
ncbi:non-specific lipid transfer protein GPI-anchored 1 [Elaeis guineensis]|uniref:Non-specific lipid transfer protein GPI-anchored 1 isoform X1 n=1 Tax=Elaeis guineensis var. tenera TaxID=51953 RepID=A0A1D5AIW8_ELAGV|nr:non-specific lipid transfer protein GPI-anchored 1 isoform X1 [Elaeis guineensis]AOC88995.1 type X nonspecific lipid transfer protein LTPX04 [Elaeis guineensis]